ncbi:MAG: PLDc_N domain-containing protein [Flammeovirgaceae bacterium]|nr:PLDc_N domain-containing protein [Flammeovirgaceae bacterium]
MADNYLRVILKVHAMIFVFGFPGPQEYAILVVGVVMMAFALSDIIFSKFRNTTDKILWIVAVVLFNVFGCLAYFFFGRQQKTQKA